MKLIRKIAELRKNKKDSIQVLIIGAPGVGKSSMVKDLLGVSASKGDTYKYESQLQIEKETLHATLIDTDRYHSIPSVFQKAVSTADMFILVYSVEDDRSKEFIQYTLNEISIIKGTHTQSLPILIVGNKLDLLEGSQPNEIFDNSKNGAFDKDLKLKDWCTNQVKVSYKHKFNTSIVKEGIFFLHRRFLKGKTN